MDESSLEQQFRKSDAIVSVEKSEAILLVLVGLTAGRLGGQHAVRRNTGRFENSLWIALVPTMIQ